MVNDETAAFAEEMRADLLTFVDPGTEPVITARNGELIARWFHDFDERDASVNWDRVRGQWIVEHGGKRMDYASFVAGPELADLRALAKNMVTVLGRGRDNDRYVAGRARLSGSADEDAATLVERASTPENDPTKIVFVTGDAGAGKSRMLHELTYNAAARYLRGETDYLYLNVSAQGRGLARLNEALATELQDLRARMTYHSVARLVRHGRLRLIVDGFDELIGGQGTYEEAFGSLAGFIEELDGRGSVIAAARSVYYEQEFLARTNSSSELGTLLWSLVPVEMRPWGTTESDRYLQHFSPEVRDRVQRLRRSPGVEGQLLDKPLFLARTCELMEQNQSIDTGRPLLAQLVGAYVQREVSSKLVGQHGQYLSSEQYVELLEEIAIEMWRQKTRELNRATLHDLVSLFAQLHELPTEAQQNLIDAAPSRAMLKLGTKPGTVAFEHDLFFGFFLAKPIEEALVRGSHETASILRRANLPVEAARAAVSGVIESGASGQSILSILAQAVDPNDSFAEVVGRNAGTLAAEVLRLRGTAEQDLLVQNVTFADAETSGITVNGASLVNTRFERSDLRNTRFESCVAQGVTWHLVLIDPNTTRLGIDGATSVDFVGLRVADGQGRVEQDFGASSMLNRLQDCGLGIDAREVDTREIDEDVLAVVEKIARHYSRSNMLCVDDSGTISVIANTPAWPRVIEAAKASGVIRQEHRATAGRPKTFYRRMVLPETLLAGLVVGAPVPQPVADFWSRLTDA
ncbi:NACHT domain-containing protein [Kitasatospora sp. NPDC093102]|uniref:NACHT domain-containing protein n=1 Tax=Kitasatospora sp. NPDC093102 TaxID=3155069 RepID=UPI00342A2D15